MDKTSTCAYCLLPATRYDPFSGEECCGACFEVLAGIFDYRHGKPTLNQALQSIESARALTDQERVQLAAEAHRRFGET